MIVNAMGVGQRSEGSDRYVATIRAAIAAALDRSVRLSEIEPDGATALGAMIYCGLLGLNIAAKSGAPPNELDQLLDGLTKNLDHWRKA